MSDTGDETEDEIPEFLKELSLKASQEEQSKLQELEQEEEALLDPKNLKKLYILGQGAFGEAAVYIDEISQIKYARKSFTDMEEYIRELSMI